MATWSKKKVNSSDVNNGNQFNAGDGLRNTDVNKIFESGLYTQDMVENIGIGNVRTTDPGSSAKVSVTYNSSTGYPQLNFDLPRGATGPQGEPGSVGTLSENICGFWTSITVGSSITLSKNYNKFIMYVSGGSTIITPSQNFASIVEYDGGSTIISYGIRFEAYNKTFKITNVTVLETSFNEDGTIVRNMSYKNSGDTLYSFALIGLNF